MRAIFLSFVALLLVSGYAIAAERHLSDVPASPDRNAHYLFYLHGGFLEMHPDGTVNPRLGKAYDWSGNINALAAHGVVVISEIRDRDTRPPEYARKVVSQIERLIAAGVPARRITVSGHSKGGAIANIVAGMAQNGELGFVNMAGCGAGPRFGRQFERFTKRRGSELQGRFLSLYDDSDDIAGSCRPLVEAGATIEFSEKVFSTGQGHGLFYGPDKRWIDAIAAFAKAGE